MPNTIWPRLSLSFESAVRETIWHEHCENWASWKDICRTPMPRSSITGKRSLSFASWTDRFASHTRFGISATSIMKRATRPWPKSIYQEALALYRSNEDTRPLELANAIRSLAVLKGEAAEIEEATKLWREAHDLYLAVNVAAGVAESAARLAILAWRQGDRERSREWLRAAKAAAEASDDPKSPRYVDQVRAMIES